MIEWIEHYRPLCTWIGLASLAMCIASAVLAPLWIIRLPADYLVRLRRERRSWANRGMLHALLAIGKNLLGVLLILAGLLMLVLPGQGLLAVFIGILLLDFPGKYRLVRWVGTRPAVWRSINWLRKRAGKPAFVLEPE